MKFLLCFVLIFFSYQNSYGAEIVKYSDYLKEVYPCENIYNNPCGDVIDRLVLIKDIEYYGLDGKLRNNGRIVVMDVVAESIIKILDDLKKIKFPFYKIGSNSGYKTVNYWFFFKKKIPITDYNYTAAYSCRAMASGGNKSIHSYGLAIDVNPLFNPYLHINHKDKKVSFIIPKDGIYYLNMIKERLDKPTIAGKIDQKVVDIFKYHGWSVWGGYWDFPIDSMHFQIPNQMAKLLAKMDYEDSKKLYDIHVKYVRNFGNNINFKANDLFLSELYKTDRTEFWKFIKDEISNIK